MKPSSRRNLAIALSTFIPLTLFYVARETASWRPQKVAELPYDGAVIISPDERFVANASREADGLVSIRNLQTGEEEFHNSVKNSVTKLAFSPDSRSLALGWRQISAAGNTIRIGVSLWNFDGHLRDFEAIGTNVSFDTPTQLRFSPDCKTLWMASTDNLRAWQIASGKLKWQWRKEDFGRDSSLPFSRLFQKIVGFISAPIQIATAFGMSRAGSDCSALIYHFSSTQTWFFPLTPHWRPTSPTRQTAHSTP